MTTSTLFVVLICLFITGNAYAAWKPLPLNLRRVIGSMTAAADHVGGTYVRGISAYGNQKPDGTPMYRVKFVARFGIVERECRALVLWYFLPSGLKRVVENAVCRYRNSY